MRVVLPAGQGRDVRHHAGGGQRQHDGPLAGPGGEWSLVESVQARLSQHRHLPGGHSGGAHQLRQENLLIVRA